MKIRLYSAIASILIFTGYIIYIRVKYGQLKSISASWYWLNSSQKWLFTLALWGFTLPLSIAGNTALFFLAAGGICFTGAAADTKSLSMTEHVHTIGATGGIILGMGALLIDFHLWYIFLPFFLFSIYMIKKNIRNHTYWIETIAYYTIWIAILLNILKIIK